MENARHNVEDVRHHATAQKWRILPCAVTAWHAVNAQGLHIQMLPGSSMLRDTCVVKEVSLRASDQNHSLEDAARQRHA
eukprot:scaffold60695_cov21-Tisochrysis_lutea.AAC.1